MAWRAGGGTLVIPRYRQYIHEMKALFHRKHPALALFAALLPLCLGGCLGLSNGSELIPPPASGPAPTQIAITKGDTPQYSWLIGSVSSIFVVRTSDPSTPVWGIQAQGDAQIIPSPQTQGTTAFTDPNLQLMSSAELSLTNGVEYRVCITGAGPTGIELYCTTFIPPDGTSVPLTTPGNSLTAGSKSMVLTADGAVRSWGNGNTSPTAVGGLSNVTAIASGGGHSLAVTADGSVWAWGANGSGQLGNGTTDDSATPVRVVDLQNIIAVAAGDSHSLALDKAGRVWAWGENSSGQLGDGTTVNRSTPKAVPALGGITAIAAGKLHSLALSSDGTVWAWGGNYTGQLGNGTVANSSVPVKVGG